MTSMVTGEPIPVAKAVGFKVTAGTLNQTGGFVMRAEKVGADTLLSQIVHMVAAAQRSRAPIRRMADQVAGWFVPALIAVAVVTFAAWMVWGPSPAFSYAHRAGEALSHATMRNIRQNLFLSFAYNVAGIPLAAGVLFPWFGLLLSPVVAAAAMALSSVSVIGNALRLRTVKVE
jgi:cation transport ATPase